MSNRTEVLCESVCRHLDRERRYLERIRECILEWPAQLVAATHLSDAKRQMTELESERQELWNERDHLLERLRAEFHVVEVQRISQYPWSGRERELLERSQREVRLSIARLKGAIRGSSRTLMYWSESVTYLLSGLTGADPRAGRYTSTGGRAGAMSAFGA